MSRLAKKFHLAKNAHISNFTAKFCFLKVVRTLKVDATKAILCTNEISLLKQLFCIRVITALELISSYPQHLPGSALQAVKYIALALYF